MMQVGGLLMILSEREISLVNMTSCLKIEEICTDQISTTPETLLKYHQISKGILRLMLLKYIK